jgi:light-harvesting complex 1 beta chain
MASLSGLTEDEAKEFHEQFKITFSAFLGVAAVAHLLVLVSRPWF